MFPGTPRRQFNLTQLAMLLPHAAQPDRIRILALSAEAPRSMRKPRMMIEEPGHGGKAPGAIRYGGTEEQHIVPDTAKYLQAMLTMDDVDARLTRMDGIFVPLYERVLMAHYHEADLLVSLHAWPKG